MKNIKKYKIIYVGGAVDHIVLPVITELYDLYGNDFVFVSTYEKPGLRTGIGYDYSKLGLSFVIKSYTSKLDFKYCKKLIESARVVIYQNVKNRSLIRGRLFSNKITFKCTERFYKTPTTIKNLIRRVLGTIFHYHLFNKRNKYVLCMGGYVAEDLKKAHLFKGKMLTWGYFTETTKLPFIELSGMKKQNVVPTLCWVGRFVKEKQPYMVLRLAEYLKHNGIKFQINMGGYGPLIDECKDYVADKHLNDCVNIIGPLTLSQKEELLNKSSYFLFTSTNEEGWGAVVNEAMGSACICFATSESGSPKTLIQDKENGFLFSCFNQDEFNRLVLREIKNFDFGVSKKAYDDIQKYWNAKVATKKLSAFISHLLIEQKDVFEQFGPCSDASAVSNL